mmetsp:Transcript_3977/g.8017  ORF Transcript_3977/g.8017 Transcript_3977/m.8017 type:complete len:142 (+) Transcript_3977:172-597(+)
MNGWQIFATFSLLISIDGTHALKPTPLISRRAFAAFTPVLVGGVVATTLPKVSSALDMDAFANSELASDTPKKGGKLSEDEALCRFGGASSLRAEACSRAGMQPKSGLRPDGKVDRGDFKTCKKDYIKDLKGNWEATWACN